MVMRTNPRINSQKRQVVLKKTQNSKLAWLIRFANRQAKKPLELHNKFKGQ